MSQRTTVGPVEESVGYVLKQAASALRTSMEAVLRPLELSVTQYSCLEVLRQRSGVSASELARATFVTRQSMSLVLEELEGRGLLTRAASAPRGRALPTELTAEGRAQLDAASAAVRGVEEQMLASLDAGARRRLLGDLQSCAAALQEG